MSTTPAAQSAAPAAGDLLDVVALDRTGTLVRSDGTLVRYYELIPQNPEVLAEDQREVIIDGLGRALGALRAGETLQIYAVAAPIQLPELLTQLKQRLADCLDTQPADRACAYRELAAAYEQTLRRRTIDNAAVRLRIYLIVPFSPENVSARVDWKSQLPGARRIKARAGVSRALTQHAQACRQAEVHADSVCHELEALGFTAIPLAGGEIAELIYRRLNPSTTTRALIPRLQITGELDAIVDAGEAAAAAQQLRAQLADSPISFTDGRQVAIEEDLEQTIYVSSVAETTPLGWTLEAMKLDRPYVLSMHVHATNRIAERRSASRRYRRLFGLNEGARQRSQTPNPDRLAQEQEAAALLDDMRSRKRTGIYEVSLYQAIRQPGPHADPVSLAEAAHRAAQAIQEASEATAKLGAFMQQHLLVSTLPIGLDAGRRQANLARRYVTRHAAASLPVFGSSCGSPLEDGALPFFSARGLQTLEGFNPWDRLFINRLMLVNGLQGSGKTMFGICTAARLLPFGPQITVLDRSDHWQLLAQLVPGAAHLSLGPGRGHATINPWDTDTPGRSDPSQVGALLDLHEVLIGARHAGTDSYAFDTFERSQMETAIRETYVLAGRKQRSPLERDLQQVLYNMRDSETERAGSQTQAAAVYDNLARRLDQYVGEGRDAYLVDRPTTVPADSPLVVFDTRPAGKQIVAAMFIALQHTLAKIDRRREQRLRGHLPAAALPGDVLITDEAWQFFQRRSTADNFHDVVRRSRHLGLFLMAITQHLDDFNNDQGRPLLRSATMKLFFQQSAEELSYLRETLGLSANEVTLISRLGTAPGRYSRAYWINGPRGRAEIELTLGGTEYWLATSNPNDQPRRQAGFDQHPGNPWAALQWLAEHETRG